MTAVERPSEFLRSRIATYCDKIAHHFSYPDEVRVTVVVRLPWVDERGEGNLVVSNEPDPEAIIEVVRRRLGPSAPEPRP